MYVYERVSVCVQGLDIGCCVLELSSVHACMHSAMVCYSAFEFCICGLLYSQLNCERANGILRERILLLQI